MTSSEAVRRRGPVRRALAANLLGTLWGAAVSILAVPAYVRHLGLEAYGLIGLFVTLTASLSVLDLGLASTVTREIARSRGAGGDAGERAEFLRTLEVIYLAVALVLAGLLTSLAGPLARYWVRPEHLPVATVEQAFRHMALAIAASWPTSLYVGALLGFERQSMVSGVTSFFATTRALGILAVFAVWEPSVDAFFLWQTLNAAMQAAILAFAAWREVPGHFARARFRSERLRAVHRFALGVMFLDGTGLVLSQLDKIVLSKVLPLDSFGAFALVSTVSANVTRVVAPVYSVYFPRLSALVAQDDRHQIERTYQDGAGVLAVLVIPLCVMLALFAPDVLFVWTGDRALGATAGLLLAVMVSGRLLNSVMYMPAALMSANGWTRLSVYNNVASIVALVPMLWIGVRVYGAMGAAIAWTALCALSMLVQLPIMHRRILPGQLGAWFRQAFAQPVALALAVAAVGRLLSRHDLSRIGLLVELGAVGGATLLAVGAATPHVRTMLVERLARES